MKYPPNKLSNVYEELFNDIKFLKDNFKKINLKKYIMWKLAAVQEDMNNNKKAVAVYL